MKKIFIFGLISLILIAGLFILTGRDDNNSSEEQTSSNTSDSDNTLYKLDKEDVVNKLHFNYSSDATIKDTSNGKNIENENYRIVVSHQKDKTSEEIANSRNLLFISTDEINKIDWNKYNYKDEQVSTVIYMNERDNGTYLVSISHDASSNINLDKEIEEFMKNLKFE